MTESKASEDTIETSDLDKVVTSGIDHIHLNVNEISQAINLFTGLFNCTHNIPLYIDSIDGMNSMNSMRVDVIAPASKEGYFAKMMQKMGGEGISAISFYVEDIDDATRRIEAAGLKAKSKIGYPEIELQTQFRASDSFGMSIELVYLYPDAEQKILAIKRQQSQDNNGVLEIQSETGAVKQSGIDHVRLRVKDVDKAIALFSRLFECQWQQSIPGIAARSTLGIHLLKSDDGVEGVDAFAISVHDLAQAGLRAEQMGLSKIDTPAYLSDERCLCFAPADCFSVSMILMA